MATPQALEYEASWVGLSVSSAATASQPISRSAAGSVLFGPGLLGMAAVSVGWALPSLPVANTTMPPFCTTKGRYSAAMGAVAVRSVQYTPPRSCSSP